MPSGHRDAVRSSCRSAAGAVARPLAARLQQRNGWPGPQGYPHRLQLRVWQAADAGARRRVG